MVDYRLHEQLLAQLNTRVLKDYILSCKHNVTITEEKTTRGVDSQTRGNASIWRGGAARARGQVDLSVSSMEGKLMA
jgi:hypothetical protein